MSERIVRAAELVQGRPGAGPVEFAMASLLWAVARVEGHGQMIPLAVLLKVDAVADAVLSEWA